MSIRCSASVLPPQGQGVHADTSLSAERKRTGDALLSLLVSDFEWTIIVVPKKVGGRTARPRCLKD